MVFSNDIVGNQVHFAGKTFIFVIKQNTSIISDINSTEESVKQKNINSKVNSIFPTTPVKSKKKGKRGKRRKIRSPSFIIDEEDAIDGDSGEGEGNMFSSKQSKFKFIADSILNMQSSKLNFVFEEHFRTKCLKSAFKIKEFN